MEDKDVIEEVKKVVEGDDTETPPVETPEDAASQEVKTEPEEEIKEEVEENPEEPEEEVEEVEPEPEKKPKVEKSKTKQEKLEEQISNLNIAIKNEREGKREDSEKITALQEELDEKNSLITDLKNKPEELKLEEDYTGLTAQQVEEIFERKSAEKEKSDLTDKQAANVKKEIEELSIEFDGKDGKPLYEDAEVFKWQKEQNKLYLSPKEAFNAMKQNELIDWEVKQRLAGKKTTKKVEKPSATKEVHEPVKKSEGPIDDTDMSKMVSEAINDVEREI